MASRTAPASTRRWTVADSDWVQLAAAQDTAPPSILVAEDDPDMRSLIASCLEQDGCEVLKVADGQELLALLEALRDDRLDFGPVDLVISDVRMPGCTGLQALEALRRIDSATPVVLITAFGGPEVHAEAHRLGAILFDKPFDLDDLRTVVHNFAQLHPPPRA